METVLLIGSGGREHAIAWKLAQSPKVSKIYVAPGNVGISRLNKVVLVDLNVDDKAAITQWCQLHNVSLVVIGPEAPLAAGLADCLQNGGGRQLCFGPSKMAAQIESDKIWAKQVMDAVQVPTARWRCFSEVATARTFIESDEFSGWVIKASGLAAGKGVCVALTKQEALDFVDNLLVDRKFGSAGENIIIEEVLYGVEVSVLAFTDGREVRVMPPAQDHKRALDGDRGGMTGGMGAYCPCPYLSQQQVEQVKRTVIQPVVDKLSHDGTPFVGVLYAGLMLTESGPKVLEFNCRFGDPETEVLLPLLDTDLYDIMKACCTKQLKSLDIEWKNNLSAVTVIIASKGYPETSSKGDIIEGIDLVESLDSTLVFHCGTRLAANSNDVVTNGGRVLAVVAVAEQLSDAVAKANTGCARIHFAGAQYRRDIGHKGIARDILDAGELTYEQSGVSIDAADTLIESIKSCAKSTHRSGVCGGIGGFGGLFDTKLAGYKDPLLVSGTDGVGTKLKIAQATGLTSTIGIDLVAMCANDILTHGAEPLFFLDYYATGELRVQLAANVIGGIAEGCRQAGCALIGGETAEMPGMYVGGDFDLAGFVVGAVERSRLLPLVDSICAGDAVIGLPSTGVHSNGYSLVRKVIAKSGHDYCDQAPFSKDGKTLGEELIAPTKMYVKPILPVLRQNLTKALAHITGGGLTDNIPRILNSGLRVELDACCWQMPDVFPWLCATGRISEPQMLRTFNCGVGMVIICSPENKQSILNLIPEATVIGTVHERSSEDQPQVKVLNFSQVLEPLMLPYIKPVITKLMAKKRVAVLISGNGSNLQALIDATKGSTIAEIVLVISNKDNVMGLERAKRANITSKVIDHKLYPTREAFEEELDAVLTSSGVDLVCLAGFMRVLTGYFVSRWRGKLINLHPSLLPAFRGANAIADALAAGVRVTGCSVHFVEETVDSGVIVSQAAVPVAIDDTEKTLAEKIHAAEHRIFPQALLDLAAGKIRLDLQKNRLVA